jgi:hypothetical protein
MIKSRCLTPQSVVSIQQLLPPVAEQISLLHQHQVVSLLLRQQVSLEICRPTILQINHSATQQTSNLSDNLLQINHLGKYELRKNLQLNRLLKGE